MRTSPDNINRTTLFLGYSLHGASSMLAGTNNPNLATTLEGPRCSENRKRQFVRLILSGLGRMRQCLSSFGHLPINFTTFRKKPHVAQAFHRRSRGVPQMLAMLAQAFQRRPECAQEAPPSRKGVPRRPIQAVGVVVAFWRVLGGCLDRGLLSRACTQGVSTSHQTVLGRLSLVLGRFSLDLIGFWVGVVRVWFHIRGVSFMRTRVGARFAQKTKEIDLF